MGFNGICFLYTDGGSRNNPGDAGIGWVIYDSIVTDTSIVSKGGEYIGVATNNEAEYSALIKGLEEAKRLGARRVSCFLDSALVVNQLKGKYRIKKMELAELAGKVKRLEKSFDNVNYTHVRREKNKLADRLVNEAIDLKSRVS